jgi:hypothetical protein
VSIDDYLDGLLSGSSEPSKKAIMKLTKLIENFGAIMVKSTERMEDYIDSLDSRINAIEQALGLARQSISPSFQAPAQIQTFSSPVAAPVAQPSFSAPNLSSNNPGTIGAPNLSSQVGAPDLSVAPKISSDSPEQTPIGQSAVTGAGISSADLLKAASKLTKAPVQEPGVLGAPGAPGMEPAPAFSPFGVSASDIKDVKAGLKKVDQDEHRRERAAAAGGGGSMPASMALNMEVKEALAKRSSRSKGSDDEEEEEEFQPPQTAAMAPQKSTKQMKEALQGELRNAFSSLLESDTKEEE